MLAAAIARLQARRIQPPPPRAPPCAPPRAPPRLSPPLPAHASTAAGSNSPPPSPAQRFSPRVSLSPPPRTRAPGRVRRRIRRARGSRRRSPPCSPPSRRSSPPSQARPPPPLPLPISLLYPHRGRGERLPFEPLDPGDGGVRVELFLRPAGSDRRRVCAQVRFSGARCSFGAF